MRLLILLAFIGTAIAVPRQQTRIVGGSPTTVQQYPFMSNMQYLWSGAWWLQACGGSLLTTRTVLSAAHCYYGDSPLSWRVRLGSSFATTGGSVHPVSHLILHENYDDATFDNDVAIVFLDVPAVLSDVVARARIVGSTFLLPSGSSVTAIGWGALSFGGVAPEQLQHVDINIIDQTTCAERYSYLRTQPGFQNVPDVTDGMVCSGVLDLGGRDACQGDSGGPLVISGDIVYGITSWGYGCAHEFYPGVNARVAFYSSWIVQHGSV